MSIVFVSFGFGGPLLRLGTSPKVNFFVIDYEVVMIRLYNTKIKFSISVRENCFDGSKDSESVQNETDFCLLIG